MSNTESAVILVAGEGKRLRPFTLAEPKCFARVAGCRILENTLQALAATGCHHVRIVTGHLGEWVRKTITERFAGMEIEYVHNATYAVTNSMYSLALGLEGLDRPTWIFEGDVFFEHAILRLPASPDITWFVDSMARHLDGSFVEFDGQGRARAQKIMRDLAALQPNQAKSAGILKLTAGGVRQMRNWLQQGITAGRQNDYYDLIVGEHMSDGRIHVVDIAGRKWFEIDTNEDLETANQLFK